MVGKLYIDNQDQKCTWYVFLSNYHKAYLKIAQRFMTVPQKALFQSIYRNRNLTEICSVQNNKLEFNCH